MRLWSSCARMCVREFVQVLGGDEVVHMIRLTSVCEHDQAPALTVQVAFKVASPWSCQRGIAPIFPPHKFWCSAIMCK